MHALLATMGPGRLTLFQIIQSAGLASNLVLCLDAADLASYSGAGQVWSDTSGNGYDFNLGTTSGAEGSDPTFNGVAGAKSASEYWSFDGGDTFTYDSAVEAWMSALHQNSAAFSFIAGVFVEAGDTARVFDTASNASQSGVTVSAPTLAAWSLSVRQAGAGLAAVVSGGTPTADAWNFLGMSIDEASATGGIAKTNGTTTTGLNPTYTSPSAAAAQPMRIGSILAGPSFSSAGTRLAFLAIWNAALTSANLDELYSRFKPRRAYGF